MVTQIQLGSFYQQNGRYVMGGGQSGFDTESIINSLVEAKRLSAATLETKNKTISTQLDTYSSFKSLLSRFQTSLDALRNPPGVNNASNNIFQYRTANLTTNIGLSASNYLDMTVQPGAAIQTFSVTEISSIARETKQESNSFMLANPQVSVVGAAGSSDPDTFAAGTFSLRNATGGDPVDITLEEGDSLQTVVSRFNEVKSQTGIQATLVKVANGSPNSTYKILFSATQTGTSYAFDLADSGTVLSDPDNVLGQIGVNTTQSASNAEFKLDGVSITRETNAVDDLIDGITFTLRQVTTGTSGLAINARIEPDTEIAANAINQFVDVYNEFRVFAAQQQQLGDDGLPTEDSVLYNSPLLRDAINQVASEVTRVISGITGGDPSRLADIGISFENFDGDEETPATKNIMRVDAEKLTSALSTNYNGVAVMFGFTMTSSSSNLSVYSRTNDLKVSDFTLNLDFTNGVYRATYSDSGSGTTTVDLDMSDLGGGVISLKGRDGTVLAGLQLIYAGDEDTTISVKTTQGFADRLYNVMNAITRTTTGTYDTTVTALQDQKKRNDTEIRTIDDRMESYRESLVTQYSALEAALTRANQLLQMLDAQAQAREAS